MKPIAFYLKDNKCQFNTSFIFFKYHLAEKTLLKYKKKCILFLIFFRPMEYLPLIKMVLGIHFLALLSPGPSFLICLKNSLACSRKAGVATAIGVGMAAIIHITYSLTGIAAIASHSEIFLEIIRFTGGGYLIYLGLKTLFSEPLIVDIKREGEREFFLWRAFRSGFLVDLLNPKAVLFFVSLFALAVEPETPRDILWMLCLLLALNAMLVYSLIAIFFTQRHVLLFYRRFQGVFQKFFGVVLMMVGAKIILMAIKF